MKFEVNRDVFSDAVSFVVKLLPPRPTLPILTGVVLEATAEGLQLSTFDYEVSSRTTVEATVETPGAVLVQGRLLADIANRLPDAPVILERDNSGVVVHCGRATFQLPTMPIEQFPALPTIEGSSGTISATEFSEAISQVAVAASNEDVTPVITGVHLTFHENELEMVATDRYRVAVRTLPWHSEFTETVDVLVPHRTIAEVGKSFARADQVRITLVSEGERQLLAFTANGRTVTSLLIKGHFPKVERLFPNETPHFAVVQVSEVVDAVRRMQIVLEREQALRFNFSQNGLQLDAVGVEQAAGAEELNVALRGADIVVSLKPQFLLEGVTALHCEFARIAFTATENPNKPGPVLITGQSSLAETAVNDSFKYLLQPNLLMR